MLDIEEEIELFHSVEELERHLKPIYIIDDLCESENKYIKMKESMTTLMCGSLRLQELIDYPIHFKFYRDDGKTHVLPFRMFLINLFIWFPLVELHGIKVANESFIIKAEGLPDVNIFIFKTIIISLRKFNIDERKIDKYAADVVYDLNLISLYFSLILSLHFSDHTIISLYEEYKDLFEMSFPRDMQPSEIETILEASEKELARRFMEDERNPFGIILKVGGVLKIKQLREMFIMVGLRLSLTGEVIPYPINESLTINGLNKPSYKYLDALGARKPLLANNKEMGPIGYFCKALNILAHTLKPSRDTISCDTRHYINYEVKTQAHLRRLVGKYYYDDVIDDFRPVRSSDTFLIGKKVPVRSVLTCSCGENTMCPTCIGESINLNWDFGDGFSAFITEEYSKDIEQKTLSTKHLLTTSSEKIEFSDEFYKWFTLYGEEIRLLDGLTNRKDIAIYIDPDDVMKIDEMDPSFTYNTYIDTGEFKIVNLKTDKEITVSIKNDKSIFIRTEISEMLSANDNMIYLKDVEDDTPLFEISIENNELVKPYHDFIAIIDSKKKRNDMEDVTLDTMSQRIMDIFVDAGIKLPITAGEIILNRICRKPDDVRRRPNFSKKKLPEYEFYSMSKAIEENGSPLIGLIYEQLQRQILKLDTIGTRTDTSYIDPMFKEWVSTEPLMYHREMLNMEDDDNEGE